MKNAFSNFVKWIRGHPLFAQINNAQPPLIPSGPKSSSPPFSATDNAIQNDGEETRNYNIEILQLLAKQSDEFIKTHKHLETIIRKEIANATRQLEAYIGVQNFLSHGEHLPRMHGWPISPDFALYLIELISSNDYDMIIEFGSGTSTVLMARVLARVSRKTSEELATIQVAFEHLAHYHRQTQNNLEISKLNNSVKLLLTPLQPYQAPNGNTYNYYNCQQELADLGRALPKSGSKILVVVDGPPGTTGKHARYPALPLIVENFKHSQIDILLDDYVRKDEKEIVSLWAEELNSLEFTFTVHKLELEKEACLLSIPSRVGYYKDAVSI